MDRFVRLNGSIKLLLMLGALVHAWMALSINLSPDEAHYALYASRLDWSYFDHPPLVGWVQWPFLKMGGSDFAMRIVPMASWVLTALLMLRLSRLLFPVAVAPAESVRWEIVLLVLSPMLNLLGIALVPDTLLVLLTVAVMLVTWRLVQVHATQPQAMAWGWWWALGFLLGLAGLAKYTAVLLALGVACVLALTYRWDLLRQPGLLLALLVALVCVLPVVHWNAQHDWISFNYQLKHAAGGAVWQYQKMFVFALVLLLVYGLALFACLLFGERERSSMLRLRAQKRISPELFCACFSLPSLALFLYLSGRGSTLPHWAAPAVVALLPWAGQVWGRLHRRRPRLGTVILASQAAMCVAMVALMLSGGIASEKGPQANSKPGEMTDLAPRNPFADLHGWQAAAQEGLSLAKVHGADTLAVMNWSLASRIAWYAKPWPVKVIHSHKDQFDLWFGRPLATEKVLLVDWSLMSFEPPVGPHQFQSCQWLASMPVEKTGRQLAHFNFMLCQFWQGPDKD